MIAHVGHQPYAGFDYRLRSITGASVWPIGSRSEFDLLEEEQSLRQITPRPSFSVFYASLDGHCDYRQKGIRPIPIGIHAVDTPCNRFAVSSMRAFPTSTH